MAGVGPWRLGAAEWEELECLRWGGSEPSASTSHFTYISQEGMVVQVGLDPSCLLLELSPMFRPSICCMPDTTLLGISRSSQESKIVLVGFVISATFLHGLKAVLM